MLQIRVTGLSELRQRLRGLDEVAQSQVMLQASKAAMQPMADAAKEDYPRSGGEEERARLGHLADTIQVFNLGKDSEYAPTGEGAAVAVSYDRKHYYGHFIEYGHRVVHGGYSRINTEGKVTRGKGTETGFVPPNPVFRRAFEAHKDEAIEIFASELRERIAKKLGER
jgi:HK97 gp10 family phage protein